jgi:exosortase B
MHLPPLSTWKDYLPLGLVLVGWAAMFGPAYQGLADTIWASDANGHGPIILAVSLWLMWRKREALLALERKPATATAIVLMLLSVAMYVIGRSQTVWTLEIASQNLALIALLLFFFGWAGVRVTWFPLLFLVFMIPWPGEWIDAVTQPLKSAVSVVAAGFLYELGYPVGRSGVILTVGPYQLLVADACAGLNSIFTLEALGLLYLNLMNYTSPLRNVLLAILIVPIAFLANVVRVIILVLVTYHFGDEAGQGFVHGFAGMVLFMVALMLILATDQLLSLVLPRERRSGEAAEAAAGTPAAAPAHTSAQTLTAAPTSGSGATAHGAGS